MLKVLVTKSHSGTRRKKEGTKVALDFRIVLVDKHSNSVRTGTNQVLICR
jgi:hypothetical protein